ncbi:MAG: WbuC family cupin fold metalloprotein [Magnetospirillum sp.]|nr:WbuC family cupin fold metalloprotein [Magnetospirillum sp.]
MKTISTPDLAALSAQAAARPRQRINLNLHAVLEDPIQRLVNALEPGTYIRPHRHGPGVWEAFILLRGRAAVLTFDEDGRVAERVELAADGVVVAELAEGTRHTIVSLAPDTAVFEIKPGP